MTDTLEHLETVLADVVIDDAATGVYRATAGSSPTSSSSSWR
jgi:hypothetical protein